MAYRLEPGEAVPAGVKRIVLERIDRAVQELAGPPGERHEGVHEARKRFKEIRAALRLVRDELDGFFPFENVFYRDSGRHLSEARDAQAMIESLDKLRMRFEPEAGNALFARVRDVLEANLERHSDLPQTGGVLSGLEEARARVAIWPLQRTSFAAIGPGLRRTYAQGRRAFELTGREPLAEHFHEWRKRVKDHWYHAQILQGLWPEVMKVYAETLKDLSRLLGDDHDLAVLRGLLVADADSYGGDLAVFRLLQLIDRRRSELEFDARATGARVYAERPSRFEERMRSYWESGT